MNKLINQILNMLIPNTVAIACTPTPYKVKGSQCYFQYCDSTTGCRHLYKYYTKYYDSSGVFQCQICDWWEFDSQICNPCPV